MIKSESQARKSSPSFSITRVISPPSVRFSLTPRCPNDLCKNALRSSIALHPRARNFCRIYTCTCYTHAREEHLTDDDGAQAVLHPQPNARSLVRSISRQRNKHSRAKLRKSYSSSPVGECFCIIEAEKAAKCLCTLKIPGNGNGVLTVAHGTPAGGIPGG